jgi:L-alanine-DL-glutamate epimerase-like enolase superfamily enzyme
MKHNRRDFSKSLIASALWLGASAFKLPEKSWLANWKPENLSKIFIEPIIIKKIDLIKTQGEQFLVVTAADGQFGITQCNKQLPHLIAILKNLVLPHFMGKDARNVANLVDNAYKLNENYKFNGMPLWNCIGTLEIACWDLLGKVVQKPVHKLLGQQIRTEYGVYISETNTDGEPDLVADRILQKLSDTGAKGIKINIGQRNANVNKCGSQAIRLIRYLKKRLSPSTEIYVDGNGIYSVRESIEFGKFLEDNGVDIFEEPCNFEDEDGLRNVALSLKTMKIASGEQVSSLYTFKRLAHTNVFDILQPDIYYNGGILCTLQVADIAKFYGKSIAPHTPKPNPLMAPFWNLAAIMPNMYGLQEFVYEQGAQQPSWYTPEIKVVNGNIQIPTTPGLGIVYDETIFTNAEVIPLN